MTEIADAAATAAVSQGYNFSVPTSGQAPYVYYVGTSAPASPPFTVTFSLPNPFTTAPSAPITADPFSLQPTVSSDNQPGLPYKLVCSSTSSVWTFDASPVRQGIHDALIAFLVAVENADGSHGTQVPKPGAVNLVRQFLAQVVPQTFAETLLFRYGLDPSSRSVDLLPGNRLRLEFQAHQALDPEQDPLNGFVGSGRAYVDIGVTVSSTGTPQVALGTFLPLFPTMSVTAASGGAGGAVDLTAAALLQPYARLLYPSSYPSSDSTGATGIQSNPTILVAPTYAGLVAATNDYVTSGTVAPPATATFFRGRVVAVPEVPVFVQGVLHHVPLGTTIRQLLSGFGPVPYMDGGGKVSVPSQFYTRQHTVFLGSQTPPSWQFLTQSSATPPVNLGTQSGGYACYSPTSDSFDLPVLGGDSVSLPLPLASG